MTSCQSEEGQKATDTSLFSKLSPDQTGVTFVNAIPETETMHHFYWESIYNGAGVGILDYDKDGLQDIYFTSNFGDDQLYRNRGNLVFEDVTTQLGFLPNKGVAAGVSIADVNNDGWPDIYVCSFGHDPDPAQRVNRLYINQGGQRFVESAAQYGLANTGYSVQSVFFDYDKDGDLDMYLMNQPSNTRTTRVHYAQGEHLFMNENTSDRLYRNDGAVFIDVSAEAGIANFAYGLGIKAGDFDQDGWVDIYVANDYDKPDYMYRNKGDGTFEEISKNQMNHTSNFSMGMDIGDVNNDGLQDIAVLDMAGANHHRSKTNMPSMDPARFYAAVDKGYHYQYMHNVLQQNQGNGRYSEIGYMSGIAKTDWSWSLLIEDVDNDRYQDIYVTNGIKRDIRNSDFIAQTLEKYGTNISLKNALPIVKTIPSTPMSNYLFRNDGHGHFDDYASQWNVADPGFSNGAAFADLDNDGDLDLVVNNVDREASIYKNTTREQDLNHAIRILPTNGGSPVLNAVVTCTINGETLIKELSPVKGFLSTSEAVIHIGIGNAEVPKCTLTWPDGTTTEFVPKKDAITEVAYESSDRKTKPKTTTTTMITELAGIITHVHKENQYDPFSTQILLPYELSEMGPFMAKGDVNGDGLEDMYIGGSAGSPGSLYIQKEGTMMPSEQPAFVVDAASEDQQSLFLDVDQDGDQDLYVVSGGYEFAAGDVRLMDRLYLNDGTGRFTKSRSLPTNKQNGGAVVALDLQNDGDQDLVVFGRVAGGKYPLSEPTYVYINDKGTYTDATATWLPESSLGLVTDALTTDVNNDGSEDIIVVGEWMTPTLLTQQENRFEIKPLISDHNGLFFSVAKGDIDKDGDEDILLGNIGLNTKWKASPQKPFQLYADDFDDNGGFDIVLAGYSDDKVVPVRGRECSSQQLPYIKDKFKTFEAFADASLDQIYDLEEAEKLQAHDLRSGVLLRNGDAYEFKSLDYQNQVAPINAWCTYGDRWITVGNLFSTEVETTRLDAGMGSVLEYKEGNLSSIPPYKSGLYANRDAKDALVLQVADKQILFVSNNSGPVQTFELK